MIAAATPTAPSQALASGTSSPNGETTGRARSSTPIHATGAVGTIQTQWHLTHWKAPLSLVKYNQVAPHASQDGQGGATRELSVGA